MASGVEPKTVFQEQPFTTVGGIINAVATINAPVIINVLAITNVVVTINVLVNTNVVATTNATATINAFGMVKMAHSIHVQERLIIKHRANQQIK